MRVTVVGGGAIGLSIAFALARRQVEVTVVERARAGGGASSAAAGMLAPLSESPELDVLARIGLQALTTFEEWLDPIEEMSGFRADLAHSGTLLLAPAGASEDSLRRRLEWQQQLDSSVAFLDPDQVARLAPQLAPGFSAAHYPGEMQVDAHRYSEALRAAAQAAGVRLLEGTPVRRLDLSEGEVVAVTGRERLASDVVVVATGADDSLLTGSGFPLPLRPVKGEMVRLRPVERIGGPIIFAPGGYLTPKPDGTILVGATQIPDRYDLEVEAASVSQLLDFGLSLVPQLREATFVEAWAGLRPALPDRFPALGPLDERGRLWVAVGHFRNGVLLSGWTAEAIAGALCDGGSTPVELAPGRPQLV